MSKNPGLSLIFNFSLKIGVITVWEARADACLDSKLPVHVATARRRPPGDPTVVPFFSSFTIYQAISPGIHVYLSVHISLMTTTTTSPSYNSLNLYQVL